MSELPKKHKFVYKVFHKPTGEYVSGRRGRYVWSRAQDAQLTIDSLCWRTAKHSEYEVHRFALVRSTEPSEYEE